LCLGQPVAWTKLYEIMSVGVPTRKSLLRI